MDGFREKRLEHENGDLSAAGNDRNAVAGRAFENNMQHHFVVPRIFMMLMMYPVYNGAMDFHIAVVRNAAYLENSIANVRSTI